MKIIKKIIILINKIINNKHNNRIHKGIGYSKGYGYKSNYLNTRTIEHNVKYKDYININIKHYFCYGYYSEDNYVEITFSRSNHYNCTTDILYKKFVFKHFIFANTHEYKYARLSDIINKLLIAVDNFIYDENLTIVNAGLVKKLH